MREHILPQFRLALRYGLPELPFPHLSHGATETSPASLSERLGPTVELRVTAYIVEAPEKPQVPSLFFPYQALSLYPVAGPFTTQPWVSRNTPVHSQIHEHALQPVSEQGSFGERAMGTVASPTPAWGWEGAGGLVPGDEGAVVDEALCQEDAGLLVALQGGPVVEPADASVIAQVAG